jgi:hypothetical protein
MNLVRPIRAFLRMVVVISAASFAACDRPAAKFRAGEKVTVKSTRAEGIVWLRLSPFADFQYFIRAPGSEKDMHRDDYYPPGYLSERPHHIEGPYYENELESTR